MPAVYSSPFSADSAREHVSSGVVARDAGLGHDGADVQCDPTVVVQSLFHASGSSSSMSSPRRMGMLVFS